MANFFQSNYSKLTANETDKILAMYPQQPPLPGHAAWYPSTSQAYGDATFTCPVVNILNALQSGANASDATPTRLYSYRYNVQDDEYIAAGFGVPHVSESAAVFGPDYIGNIGPTRSCLYV